MMGFAREVVERARVVSIAKRVGVESIILFWNS